MIEPVIISSGVFSDEDFGISAGFTNKIHVPQPSDIFHCAGNSLLRPRSLTQMNGPGIFTQESPTYNGMYSPITIDRSLRNLKGNLEDSENRCSVLKHKLKEAQSTLDLQNDRLHRIEHASRENSLLVEDLKQRENEYKRRIDSLQLSEQEKDKLKTENMKIRQKMQERVNKLDVALRTAQAQHQVAENDNQKRIVLLEQSSQALNIIEAENIGLKQDLKDIQKDLAIARESVNIAKTQSEQTEEENRDLRCKNSKIKEENDDLSRKISELSGQLLELRKVTQSMKKENEKLANAWKSEAEGKHRLSKQVEKLEEKKTAFKSQALAASSEKDRLFHDKMDLNNKYQQLLIDKEALTQIKIAQTDQLNEQQADIAKLKTVLERSDEERRKKQAEVAELKGLNDNLGAELSAVKKFNEKSLDQITSLEKDKTELEKQCEITNKECDRLKVDIEKLSRQLLSVGYYSRMVAETKSQALKKDNQEMEGLILKLKNDIRSYKDENNLLVSKIDELSVKLNKADEDLKHAALTSQEDLETLKTTCERLTSSISQKDSEIQVLSDKCLELEDLTAKLQSENHDLKEDNRALVEHYEDVKRLKDEHKRFIQANAENEQVIKLLETQNDVLRQSSESQLAKLHDVELLVIRAEQLHHDNEHLMERVAELEKIRDNLVTQKEELLANTELIYKNPQIEELKDKVDELQKTNKQLRDVNDSVNEKCETLEHINMELKEAVGGDGTVVPKTELFRVQEERCRLEDDIIQVQHKCEALREEHEQYLKEYGPEGEETLRWQQKVKTLEREKEGLEKQVALINGQLLLVEGSKKRLDEVVEDLQHEIVHLRKELEEAEKQEANRIFQGRVSGDVSELESELEVLRGELSQSKKDKSKTEQMIRSLKEELEEERTKKPAQFKESLDDVGSELTSMRGELHKLVGEIERKEQTIVTLENQLRQSKEKIEDKDKVVRELKAVMDRNSLAMHSLEYTKPKTEETRISDPVSRSKSLTERGAGDRLQSLIARYKDYGEAGTQAERRIKPLSLSGNNTKKGLVTRDKK
ncbi:myosin-2 heavy chain-like [Saccostrea echinata]|uniref:myosin-2 heavy chain-like n=1 Tax=Saccostrea echinata TaxID=191078 RepID=UPI002A82B3B6|nr:myosin-2 heavy chain-like [Saccostrea echinata]